MAITTGHAVGERAHLVERVAHPRAVGKLELDRGGAGALAQSGEQTGRVPASDQGYPPVRPPLVYWRAVNTPVRTVQFVAYPSQWIHWDDSTEKESDMEVHGRACLCGARGAAERGGDRGLREQQQQQLDHELVEARRGVEHVVDDELDQRRGADSAVVALVPAAIKSKGTLTVASDASYAPNEFFASDGHTVIGMDADLMKALAAVMGLKVNVVNATFDSIIPGLASGKYDVGASSFTDTKEREKTVDFVTYFNGRESFFTKASGGTTINSIADLCGHTVAVEKGTTEQTDAERAEQQVQEGRQARGHRAHVRRPERRQPGARRAAGPSSCFADSPPAAYAGQEVKRPVQARRRGLRRRRRTAWRLPRRTAACDSGSPGGAQGADEERDLPGDPHQVGPAERGAIPATQVKINGAIS